MKRFPSQSCKNAYDAGYLSASPFTFNFEGYFQTPWEAEFFLKGRADSLKKSIS